MSAPASRAGPNGSADLRPTRRASRRPRTTGPLINQGSSAPRSTAAPADPTEEEPKQKGELDVAEAETLPRHEIEQEEQNAQDERGQHRPDPVAPVAGRRGHHGEKSGADPDGRKDQDMGQALAGDVDDGQQDSEDGHRHEQRQHRCGAKRRREQAGGDPGRAGREPGVRSEPRRSRRSATAGAPSPTSPAAVGAHTPYTRPGSVRRRAPTAGRRCPGRSAPPTAPAAALRPIRTGDTRGSVVAVGRVAVTPTRWCRVACSSRPARRG